MSQTTERLRFESLVLPHLDAAFNLARWLTRNDHDAEDVVQEAYFRALKFFHGYRGGDAKAWLLTIVRNCWLSAGKATKRRGHTPLDEQELVADGDPEASAIRQGTSRRLEALVAQLPEDFREVLILREMEDMSYREIAEITGTPIGTVMSRLARARALLRETAKDCL